MATPDRTPQAPPELIAEGEKWAREQFVHEKGKEIVEALKEHLGSAHDVFFTHRARITQSIEVEGGIDRFEYKHLAGSGVNAVVCKSGKLFYADELLSTEPIQLPHEATSAVPEGTEQSYSVAMLFGGRGLGISAAEVHNSYHANYDFLHTDDAWENYFADDFAPAEVAIVETVSTDYDQQTDKLPLIYSVFTRTWYAKLREEFAPNPLSHPEAYRAWAEQAPIPQTEMFFQATETRRGEKDNLRLEEVQYVDQYGGIDGEKAVIKLLRFEELLEFLHRRIVPEEARPERQASVLSALSPRKALPATI